MNKINISCESCGRVHEVSRDKEAPDSAISMGCNWCPSCEDTAEDYYQEWYNYDDESEDYGNDPNQLMLFSIADNILQNHKKLQEI